jgi:futalosine hydrolase
MNVLLAVATKSEIEPLINLYGSADQVITLGDNKLNIVITGVGMVATAYSLGKELTHKNYDIAISAGIAGSFDTSIAIGEVVMVKEDHLAELGAENDNNFLSIDDMGFGEGRVIPLSTPDLKNNLKLQELKQVKGITVNTVHGNKNSIEAITRRLNPDIESMEGAAFFYACNQVNLPCLQLRAISNYVEQRNRSNWNIPLAVKNLNNYLTVLLNQL